MGSRMIEMEQKEVESLAFDVACGFFKDDQLLIRYDLELHQLASIKAQRAFLKEVDEVRRLLEDDGSEFTIAAKKISMNALNMLDDITSDKLANDTVRVKAAQSIFSMAKLLRLPPKVGDAPGAGTLVIHTNLQLNQNPNGVYSLESKPEEGELIEAEYSEVADYVLVDNSDLL